MKKFALYILAIVMIASITVACFACDNGNGGTMTTNNTSGVNVLPKQERLRIATTTSLYDTGLWSLLEPRFEQQYNMQLDIISTGSGVAFEWGRRCDIDALTIHSKADELKFIADGYGVERIPFAYNYFVIAGPATDPAGIKGLGAADAFKKISDSQSIFVSRGDASGTHTKEKSLWAAAGLTYSDIQASAWYVSTGKGMGDTLYIANDKQGYVLSDIGTFLSYKGNMSIVSLVDKGSDLLNVYSVIAINSSKCTKVNSAGAAKLIEFLTSNTTQTLIGEYGAKQYGTGLFTPCFGNEPTK